MGHSSKMEVAVWLRGWREAMENKREARLITTARSFLQRDLRPSVVYGAFPMDLMERDMEVTVKKCDLGFSKFQENSGVLGREISMSLDALEFATTKVIKFLMLFGRSTKAGVSTKEKETRIKEKRSKKSKAKDQGQ